jgi:aminodeoxyfutalosine synthase
METLTSLDVVAERVSQGGVLSAEDARAILGTRDLIAVGMLADDLRRRKHGARTTFCRVLEVHVDAPPASLPNRAEPGEIRIVGRPASAEAALAAVRAVAPLAADVPVTGFSLADLQALSSSASSLEELCDRLREAGLSAITEAPVDSPAVRRDLDQPAGRGLETSPFDDLAGATEAIRAARGAGLMVLRLTVDSITPEQRIPLVLRARALQEAVGGFRVFAPLPRTLDTDLPTTGYDDVKQVALARLMATNIESIQIDWQLYGPKLAQVALTIGADDVDAVGAVDLGALGIRRSPLEEIKGNIRAAFLEPLERTGLFELVP